MDNNMNNEYSISIINLRERDYEYSNLEFNAN